MYDTAEQALQNQIAKPRVTLSADGGNQTVHAGNGKAAYRAWPGSIYLSDASFFPDATAPLCGGRIEIPGFNTWPYDSLTISNGMAEFPSGFELSLAGDLVIAGTGGGLSLSNALFEVGGDVIDTAPDGYSFVTADAALAPHFGGCVLLNKFGALTLRTVGDTPVTLGINNDYVVTNSAKLYIDSAVTNMTWFGPGTRLAIGGEMIIASNSSVYPSIYYSKITNALPVSISARTLTILPGGVLSADSAGYAGGDRPAGITSGYGPGGGKQYGGGGYGGAGGGTAAGQGGIGYGVETLPLLPGSGGGTWWNNNGDYGGAGGGAIWLEVADRLLLSGIISANGGTMANYGAGGAGGSITIRCTHFAGTGLLQANGGSARVAGDGSGSGGGGRIAVWRQKHTFSGTAAQPAAGAAYLESRRGEPGTIYWGLIPPNGTLIMIR